MLKLKVTTKVHDMSMDTKGTLGAVCEKLALRRRTSINDDDNDVSDKVMGVL